MRAFLLIGICAIGAMAGCGASGESELGGAEPLERTDAFGRAGVDRVTSALRGPTAIVTISAEPGGSCALSCFDVQSSKDVSFIAVDAAPCGSTPVELSLYALDEQGTKTVLAVTPVPQGNGKSCPDVPPQALKFDELSGRRLAVCTAGAERADVFVKSGSTCASQSFEIGGEQCTPDNPDWRLEMGSLADSDVAVDLEGNVLYADDGVTKLDGSGEVRWTLPWGQHIASDVSGSVIVAGTFSTTIDLGFGPMTPTDGSPDVFVAKLDRDGHPIWARSFGTPADESARSVAVDGKGDIAVDVSDLFTLVLDPNGELLWGKPFGGAVAFDAAGNLAVTGGFSGALDVGTQTVESTGGTDAFVVKLDPSGNPLWSHFFGDVTSGDQRGTSVAFDPQGNMLSVGEVSGSIRLFGTDYVAPTNTEYSTAAAYLIKLDPSGNALWSNVRTFTEDMRDVGVDAMGNVYVTGGVVGNVPPFRYNFIEMYDPNGVIQWRFGSSNSSDWPGLGHGNAIALDLCNNLFWALWHVTIEPLGTRSSQAMLAKIHR